jgi:putative phage-type endonuclease
MRAPFAVDADVVLPADAPPATWLAERLHGIGGSDIAAAVGLSRYESPYRLWQVKTRRATPTPDAAARRRMRWGHLLEPVLRAEFAARHPEYVVTTAPGTYARPGIPWQRVNVDGLVWHHDGELAGVLECKTGTHHQLPNWADDEVPVTYTAQGQWAAHITGAPRVFMAALLDTSTDVWPVLERDDDIIGDLVEMAAEFWQHVVTDIPPPVDASEVTRKALARVTARAGQQVVLDPSWHKGVRRRAELHEQIKALEAEKDLIDNQLRAAMGDAETAYLIDPDGTRRRVATHRAPKPTPRVDLERLAAEHPEVYARVVTAEPAGRRLNYTRPTTTKGTP